MTENKNTSPGKETNKSELTQGLKAAWPICLGYVPLGLACGVLAQKAGLHPLEIGLMSLLVFAGSAQFIAISMLSGGAAVVPITATTAIVNMRHLLMSSSLALHLGKTPRKWLPLFAYGITDESFAVNISRFKEDGWNTKRALVVNHASNLSWITFTILGAYGGQFIPENAFGIDYALIAMFICLLVFQLKERRYIITAIAAGAIALLISLLVQGNLYIVSGSIVATSLMVAFRRKGRKV